RCESVDFFGIEIDLQRAQEIRRILHFLLPLHEMSQPGNSLILAIVRDKFAVFVLPMRRDAFLGNLMHLSCSNLHFEGLTAGYYGSVQRLIHIRPGHRNKIFDPAGDRAPGVVDDAECGVTVLDVVSNNSKGEKIVDLVDRDALLPELQKDRIKPFDARLRKARNVVLLHLVFYDFRDFSKKRFMPSAVLLDDILQLLICLWIEITEGQILKLSADFSHP